MSVPKVCVFVDSGAQTSVVSNSVVEKGLFSARMTKKAPMFASITGVGSKTSAVRGVAELTIHGEKILFHCYDDPTDRILISVSEMVDTKGAKVVFGKNSSLEFKSGSTLELSRTSNNLYSVICTSSFPTFS